jgi:hypothetical protein
MFNVERDTIWSYFLHDVTFGLASSNAMVFIFSLFPSFLSLLILYVQTWVENSWKADRKALNEIRAS